jgi:hypothetical protein
MSLVNDLKKLLFGAKAVTKSAAGKAAGAGKEAAGEFTEKASELWDTARHKADEVTEKVIESTDNFFDKVSDKAEDFGEAAKETASDVFEELRRFTQGDAAEPAKPAQEDTPASFSSADWPQDPASPEAPPSRVEELGKTVLDTAEKVGAKVMEHGGEVMDKVMNTAEKLGEKILEKSEGVGEKVLHVAEDLGGKIMEKGGETLERAKSLGDDIFKKRPSLWKKRRKKPPKKVWTTPFAAPRNWVRMQAAKRVPPNFPTSPLIPKTACSISTRGSLSAPPVLPMEIIPPNPANRSSAATLITSRPNRKEPYPVFLIWTATATKSLTMPSLTTVMMIHARRGNRDAHA